MARARDQDSKRRLRQCLSAWAVQSNAASRLLQERLAQAVAFAFASTLREPSGSLFVPIALVLAVVKQVQPS